MTGPGKKDKKRALMENQDRRRVGGGTWRRNNKHLFSGSGRRNQEKLNDLCERLYS